MSKDLSIVIAHRGDPLGLWATVTSCEADLERSGLSYEYCICVNGERGSGLKKIGKQRAINIDLERTLSFLDKAGKIGYVKIVQGVMSAPTARQKATERATGKYLFFFDNHCLVGRDYFKRAIADFEKYDMDMLHSTTRFFSGDITAYHYKLTLAKNFWASAEILNGNYKPYQIAAGGHGGFVVKRDVWNEVGGYWDGFVGYGGEEMYFDLKMALLGKTNYLDPSLIHWHYAGQRPYSRHYTPDFYKNMMMCANIVGGEEWLYKVADSFISSFPSTTVPMFDLLMQAEASSRQHAAWLAGKRLNTLNEQLEYFREHSVAL